MARKFGKVDVRLWRSQKFAALKSDSERLAFVWVLTCRHGNGAGLYTLPAMYLATELSCDMAEAEARLGALEAVGLIERGPDDVVRVVRWFEVANAPRTPSIAVSVLKSLSDVSDTGEGFCRSHAILELLQAIVGMCGGWDTETQTFGGMIRAAKMLLEREIEARFDQTEIASNNLGLSLTTICRTYGLDMADKKENENKNKIENKNQEQRTKKEKENRELRTENGERRTESRAAGAATERGNGAASIGEMVRDLNKVAQSKRK